MAQNDKITELIGRMPELASAEKEIRAATAMALDTYHKGGKILLCGNGGSAADSEHIAGELLKGFLSKRTPVGEELVRLTAAFGSEETAKRLQRGIPAIPLPSLTGASTAFLNDVDPSLVYAQLVYAFARPGDLLIGISTSGNSENVVRAVQAANAQGIASVALTGETGGKLLSLATVTVRVPSGETYRVQEYHLPVYHAICAEMERVLFEQ